MRHRLPEVLDITAQHYTMGDRENILRNSVGSCYQDLLERRVVTDYRTRTSEAVVRFEDEQFWVVMNDEMHAAYTADPDSFDMSWPDRVAQAFRLTKMGVVNGGDDIYGWRSTPIGLNDQVALTRDFSEFDLKKGDTGSIMAPAVSDAKPHWMVEFLDHETVISRKFRLPASQLKLI